MYKDKERSGSKRQKQEREGEDDEDDENEENGDQYDVGQGHQSKGNHADWMKVAFLDRLSLNMQIVIMKSNINILLL